MFQSSFELCTACADNGIACTWSAQRKRRGRPNRYFSQLISPFTRRTPNSTRTLERFQKQHQANPEHDLPEPYDKKEVTNSLYSIPVHLITTTIKIEHLCPHHIFITIFEDYLQYIYPITPIIHRPSFMSKVASRQHESDPAFLRLCLSLCAMTVSSIHRRVGRYGFDYYETPKQLVTRAYHLVMASRLATDPEWADDPTMDTLLCSLLLGQAAHYTESPSRGWNLINESLYCCRSLDLYEESGYTSVSIVDREIAKRAFWMLYIIQM